MRGDAFEPRQPLVEADEPLLDQRDAAIGGDGFVRRLLAPILSEATDRAEPGAGRQHGMA